MIKTKIDEWARRTMQKCSEDECKVCHRMRQDRKHTVSETEEARLLESKFLEAPLIVPNNDVLTRRGSVPADSDGGKYLQVSARGARV